MDSIQRNISEDIWNTEEDCECRVPRRGERIAELAMRTINGERQDQYGRPENSFAVIAGLWGAYLGRPVTPAEVADMMCLLKIAREVNGKGKKDNAVDLIGYSMIAASMRGYDV